MVRWNTCRCPLLSSYTSSHAQKLYIEGSIHSIPWHHGSSKYDAHRNDAHLKLHQNDMNFRLKVFLPGFCPSFNTFQTNYVLNWILWDSTQKSLLSILTNIAIFLAKDAKINLLHKQWEFIACNLSLHYGRAWEKPWVLFYEGGACFIMHKIVV